jgi:RimJ/RimL family protein N-acetyltransferase
MESVYAIHVDEDINRYLPYHTWVSWDDAVAWYARVEKRRGDEIAEQFVIINKDDGVLVGTCIAFIHEPDGTSLEFGYVLAKPHWGKGYMLEALNCFVPALAKQLELTRLLAVIQSENSNSIKLVGKLGFDEISREHKDDIDLIYFSRQFD